VINCERLYLFIRLLKHIKKTRANQDQHLYKLAQKLPVRRQNKQQKVKKRKKKTNSMEQRRIETHNEPHNLNQI